MALDDHVPTRSHVMSGRGDGGGGGMGYTIGSDSCLSVGSRGREVLEGGSVFSRDGGPVCEVERVRRPSPSPPRLVIVHGGDGVWTHPTCSICLDGIRHLLPYLRVLLSFLIIRLHLFRRLRLIGGNSD